MHVRGVVHENGPDRTQQEIFFLSVCFCVQRPHWPHVCAPQGPAGNVYYLDLEVLETKCHIGSPKPWKRCDIRPFMETVGLTCAFEKKKTCLFTQFCEDLARCTRTAKSRFPLKTSRRMSKR